MKYDISHPSPVSCLIQIHLSQEDINEIPASSESSGARNNLNIAQKNNISSKLEASVDNAVNRVLQKEKLRPLSTPILQTEDISTLHFSCKFEVLPPVPLPEDLTKLELHFPYVASSTALQDAVNALLSQHAKLVQIKEKRVPCEGDIALVDVTGRYNGKRVSGMCIKNQKIRITNDADQPELLQSLRVLLPGEEGQTSVLCPEDYPDPLMRGKEITLFVRLRELYREERPAFDEAFAHRLGFKKSAQLKQALFEFTMRKQMLHMQEKARRKLLDAVVGPLDFPVPSSLILRNLRQRISEAKEFFLNGGTPPEEIETILKRMHDTNLEEARTEAKIQTFLLALAEREKICVTLKETENEIRRLAKSWNESFEEVRSEMWKNGTVNDIQDILLARKALDLMAKQAAIVREESGIVENQGNAD